MHVSRCCSWVFDAAAAAVRLGHACMPAHTHRVYVELLDSCKSFRGEGLPGGLLCAVWQHFVQLQWGSTVLQRSSTGSSHC